MAAMVENNKQQSNNNLLPDSILLCDSLGRNIRNIYRTDKLYFPGCTINALAHKINSGDIDVRNYHYITLLIGTNDLGPKHIWKYYKSERKAGRSGENLPYHTTTPIPVITSALNNLNKTIRSFNQNALIFFVGIPPRPYDHHRNHSHHRDTNVELSRFCSQNNISFIKSHTSYMKFGKPLLELYSDGLHFSSEGNCKTARLIESNINYHRPPQK